MTEILWRIVPQRARGTTKYTIKNNCPAEPRIFKTLCSGNRSTAEALEFMEKAYPVGDVTVSADGLSGTLRCDVPDGVSCVCGSHRTDR